MAARRRSWTGDDEAPALLFATDGASAGQRSDLQVCITPSACVRETARLGGEQWKAEALVSNIFNYGRLTNCNSGGRLGRLSGAVAHSGGSKPASFGSHIATKLLVSGRSRLRLLRTRCALGTADRARPPSITNGATHTGCSTTQTICFPASGPTIDRRWPQR